MALTAVAAIKAHLFHLLSQGGTVTLRRRVSRANTLGMGCTHGTVLSGHTDFASTFCLEKLVSAIVL